MKTSLSLLLVLLCACESPSAGVLPSAAAAGDGPAFDGADASRPRIAVRLQQVATGFREITDLQFPPGRSDRMIILEKGGRAWWLDVAQGARGTLLRLNVETGSEMGLLGLAFHPKFDENHKIYVNYSPATGKKRTIISEFTVDPTSWSASGERVLLEVDQPYGNHDAGQVAFGPDGYLYIGLGDGGAGGDPHGHGQNASTLLGAMLRIDVNYPGTDVPYAVPADNPYLSQVGTRPELYAIGLRNPWRFSFDPTGRLIVADVGQDTWEEVDIVKAGDNLGWNVREGRHCFAPAKDCPTGGFTDPVYEYSHDEGVSISGGYVYTGAAVPALAGKYVFGDFGSGRIWALDLPTSVTSDLAPVSSLGRWPINPSTFGRDSQGEIYVGDFGAGTVYRVAPPGASP